MATRDPSTGRLSALRAPLWRIEPYRSPDPTFVINGSFRGQRVTGPQRYAIEMTAALKELEPDCHEVSPGSAAVRARREVAWAWTQTVLPVTSRRLPLVSLTARAPVHHPCHVVTVHDLFPLVHPEWYSRRYIALHAPVLRELLRTAAAVVAVSEPVAQQLRERGLVAESTPLVVAPNAPSSVLRGTPADLGHKVASISRREHYFLTVGSQDPRKNTASLIRAYLTLPPAIRHAWPLVVAGGASSNFRSVERLSDPSVRHLGYVTDGELAALYGGPATLVSASLDEGFGLPLVEAFQSGCRLLVSDIPVYRWVCGDAADYFDPRDQDSIRHALLRATESPDPSRLDPRRLPRTYDWRTSAQTVVDALRQVTGA